jgi:translation initiation factor 3 subunit A
MPTYFQRPENALKRANEFIDVGKKQRALDALYDVIKSKRHRTWQKIHEPIMEKYLDLCVDLKKSHVAKEGLYQYKNICQQVNTKSLEDIVKKYLALAEDKTEAARQASQQTADDVDDLDVLQTPESLLLSAVSGEDMQDRTDRAILTPWLKFLWESYRQCLDLLRNNSSVEKLYHEVAQNAFKFCLKYNRKTEFRKLCENLRTHLGHIYKHQNQQRAININNPETQYMHLETRLVQLDSAIQMELWQEAFKAVEDIHSLITLAKKPPRPSLMANYLQKFGLVLYKSDNFMFHACAWHRLFHLYREQRKQISEHELQRLASRVLCATLAIPLPAARNHTDQLLDLDESNVEKQKRLATLLSLTTLPTRQTLVKEMVKYNIVQYVYPELQNLYQWLEVEFHPLKLATRVQSSLEFLSKKEELVQYIPALQDITTMRVIKQISEVYQMIEFAHLAKLAPFADNFRLERIIVDAAKSLDLPVRIDHRTAAVSFGTGVGMTQDLIREGPSIQSMPSEQIRYQLINMAEALDKAMQIISPKEIKASRDELRLRILQSYRQTAKKEHASILRRRQIIEDRKEELEYINSQREQKEQEMLEEQRRRQMEEENVRLEREAEERERQRRLEEHRDIQKKVAKERIEQLKSTTLGARALATYTEEALADMDPDDILAKQVEQLEKEKRDLQEKLKAQEKKVDYFERAKCIEEIPLLQKYCEAEKQELKQVWEQQEIERIELAKKERALALEMRDRLERIRPDREEFLAKLKSERASVYKEKLSDFEKKLSEERLKRLDERRRQRKEDRRNRWIREKEEEEQRKKDEELKRQREEEERIAREKREREDAEYEEKARKLAAIEEKKRQREQEIEEKLMRKKEDKPRDEERDRDVTDKNKPGVWKKEGGWREREKAKEDSWRSASARNEEDGPRLKDRLDDEDRRPPIRDEPPEPRWRDAPREDRDRDRRRDVSPTAPREDRDWRRGGGSGPGTDDRRRLDDRPFGGGGSSWRDRERDKERGGPPSGGRDDWRRDDRDRPREDRDRPRRDFDDRGPPVRDFDRPRGDRDFDRRDREYDRPRDRDFDRTPRDRDFDRRDRDFDRPRDRDMDRGGPRDFDRSGPRDRPPRDFDRSRDAFERPQRDFERPPRDSYDDKGRDSRGGFGRDREERPAARDDWRSREKEPRDAKEPEEPPRDKEKGRSDREADEDGWKTVKH